VHPIDTLLARHRFRAIELLPWLIAVAVYFVFGDYLPLGSQILIMILFALPRKSPANRSPAWSSRRAPPPLSAGCRAWWCCVPPASRC
jgi:hypothetical protein